jgi:regulation of enolase protein 1 (concanavalin A-like superfamily)
MIGKLMPNNDSWLNESFEGESFDPRLRWFNEPPRWRIENRALHVEPAPGSDLWRRTHYGFEVDSGHCLLAPTPAGSDWVLSTRVRFQPIHQYDQAGLMVRLSERCWLKTSVEYEPAGFGRLGAVVTNAGYSDWSTQDVPGDIRAVSLRITRARGDYTVEASLEGTRWMQLRIAHLMEDANDAAVHTGIYACAPKGEGYHASFEQIEIRLLGG